MIMPDHLHGILFVERQMEQHLGMIIQGFKVGCNKAYRALLPSLASRSALLQQQQSSLLQHCCSKGDIGDIGDRKGDKGDKGDNKKEGLLPCGYLFARGYNDHILEGAGELERWFAYLRENPRRLALKRAYPDFFRVRFGITIGSQTYAAIGNRFLLSYPQKLQVQCSRLLTDEEIQATTATLLQRARQGAVLVSPAISKGEQAVMRAALDARAAYLPHSMGLQLLLQARSSVFRGLLRGPFPYPCTLASREPTDSPDKADVPTAEHDDGGDLRGLESASFADVSFAATMLQHRRTMQHRRTGSLCLDAIHRILCGSPPALDTDGDEGDGRDRSEGEREEPPVDGCALGERLEPLMPDVPGDGGGQDEAAYYEGYVAAGL